MCLTIYLVDLPCDVLQVLHDPKHGPAAYKCLAGLSQYQGNHHEALDTLQEAMQEHKGQMVSTSRALVRFHLVNHRYMLHVVSTLARVQSRK